MSPTSEPESPRKRPRVELAPPSEYTLGPEALKLAKRAGLIADPWQVDSVNLMMSVRADGKWACFEFAEWVPRQNGKGAIAEIRVLAGCLLLEEEMASP